MLGSLIAVLWAISVLPKHWINFSDIFPFPIQVFQEHLEENLDGRKDVSGRLIRYKACREKER